MKTLEEIEQKVCEEFGVTPEFLHERSRKDGRPLIRYVVAYVCVSLNSKKYSQGVIGYYFGINNSTVNVGLNVVSNELATNRVFEKKIDDIFKSLNEATPEITLKNIRTYLTEHPFGLCPSECTELIEMIDKIQ